MNGPASPGQVVKTGRMDRSTSSPVKTTSWQQPRFTWSGKMLVSFVSLGIICSFLMMPSGRSISRYSWMRSPRASRFSLSRAMFMRLFDPYMLVSTGNLEPLTFWKSRAGPNFLLTRSVTSAISR